MFHRTRNPFAVATNPQKTIKPNLSCSEMCAISADFKSESSLFYYFDNFSDSHQCLPLIFHRRLVASKHDKQAHSLQKSSTHPFDFPSDVRRRNKSFFECTRLILERFDNRFCGDDCRLVEWRRRDILER